MVNLSLVEGLNASLRSNIGSSGNNFVAVFVGGTSGIGLYTARELVRSIASPHIYLIGRNEAEASKISSELKTINNESKVSFIKKDVSLLKNVDEACSEIKSKEKHVNLLFMTCGYFTLSGRQETSEGLDRKFALHYYSRMRFITQLQPLLTAAASTPTALSRVVAVLDPQPGLGGAPDFKDLSLKSSFTLQKCAMHASSMTNLCFPHFAAQNRSTSYVHAYPSVVETGAGRDAWGVFKPIATAVLGTLLKPFAVKPQESGQRHLYAATAPQFAPRSLASNQKDVPLGADGAKGSGSYLVSWNGEVFDDTKKAKAQREQGGQEKVWAHTEEVFKKICEEGQKY